MKCSNLPELGLDGVKKTSACENAMFNVVLRTYI